MDMDIGICACSQGNSGAACKHQAAVAKAFSICSASLAPFYSEEERHRFAILARGESSAMDREFYVDLRSKGSKLNENIRLQSPSVDIHSEETDLTSDRMEMGIGSSFEDNFENARELLQEQLTKFHVALGEMVKDMLERAEDHNFFFWSKEIFKYPTSQVSHAPVTKY